MMKMTKRGVLVAAALGLSATALAAGAPVAQAAGSVHGCGYGAFCIYPGTSWGNNNPTYQFYSYGPHNIYGQLGHHRVFNHQYGHANAYLCLSKNGKGGWTWGYPPGSSNTPDLTKINSVSLTKSVASNPCR